jgi:hypothetical protein
MDAKEHLEEFHLACEHNESPINSDDVERVLAAWTDDTEEPNYAWLFLLKDGRYAAVTAWHDYTGWDCRSSLSVKLCPTRDEAISFGLTQNDRENLNLLLPGELTP